ncbi:MAG: hypothetical protein MUQ20_00585 [Deltaproteobacteria bacterium]|nr:hypothetical protein [Deltaproteobacteria bacterium]
MPSQVGDIAAALAYQVKKEIAENYFGTRKILEEERDVLIRQGEQLKKTWDREVLPVLTNIFQLFVREEEGRAFLDLIKRGDLLISIRQSLRGEGINLSRLSCSLPFALTVKGKYKNLIINLYRKAKAKEDELGTEFNALGKKVRLFNEDVEKFNSCYHLSDILSLINSFENKSDLKGVLGENTDPRAIPMLEEKLILKPLDLSGEGAAVIQTLPPLKEILGPLKQLILQTFDHHCSEIKKTIRSL